MSDLGRGEAGVLDVHLHGARVAQVVDAGDGLCAVRYTDQGVALGAPARLSLSMPVRPERYPAVGVAGRWVRGLLPEGPALDALVRLTGVPQDDPFALLSVVGADVAGAAVIIPPGEVSADPPTYTPLTEREVGDLLRQVGERPFGVDPAAGIRLSLAGVQGKVLLHRPSRRHRFARPRHGAPSTVILKPEPPPDRALPGLAANELTCLEIARAAGIDTAVAAVEVIGGVTTLVVERYDRRPACGGEMPTRVHQEDLLMALGKDPRLKYESPAQIPLESAGGFATRQPVRRDPGPGLRDLAGLLRDTLGPVGAVELLRRTVLTVAIGNADAHARNHSVLLHADGRVAMAPAYDLVATTAYAHLDTLGAQRINGVEDLTEVTGDDLVAEAVSWGLGSVATREVRRMVERIAAGLDRACRRAADRGADTDVVDHVAQLTRARLARMGAGPGPA